MTSPLTSANRGLSLTKVHKLAGDMLTLDPTVPCSPFVDLTLSSWYASSLSAASRVQESHTPTSPLTSQALRFPSKSKMESHFQQVNALYVENGAL